MSKYKMGQMFKPAYDKTLYKIYSQSLSDKTYTVSNEHGHEYILHESNLDYFIENKDWEIYEPIDVKTCNTGTALQYRKSAVAYTDEQTKKIIETMTAIGLRYGELPPLESSIVKCTHNWKQYVGMIETYKYCTKCDKKVNV